ncbi:hypothetical protein OH492_17795 [Vibrio chagasii]|nr:hypothetical protein [Vibrio chagasii]
MRWRNHGHPQQTLMFFLSGNALGTSGELAYSVDEDGSINLSQERLPSKRVTLLMVTTYRHLT